MQCDLQEIVISAQNEIAALVSVLQKIDYYVWRTDKIQFKFIPLNIAWPPSNCLLFFLLK